MRILHLPGNKGFQADFVSMGSLLDEIGRHYELSRTEIPYDSTAARFNISGEGDFGIIANKSEPFCRTCTRLRLPSDVDLYDCLSSSNRHAIKTVLDISSHRALPKPQGLFFRRWEIKSSLSG
ncbi:MAG: cyclic pyranopterin phosphate synthase [Candidatus Azotimanducaceae bacterium]|jgi:cyclic pyranopterin phosphate synthase